MYSPTTRLLTILEILQSRGSISGAELAAQLEVENRTVRRYITMLRDMGIPIEAERGRYGSYALRPGFRLPPLMFNNDEILAVVLGLMVTRKLAMTDSQGVDSSLAKIERVLPAELRHRVWALQNTLTLNLVSETRIASSQFVQMLSLATYEQKRVFVRYAASGGNITERLFDSYGLVYHGGVWYASGYCHLRQDLRTFRVDRMQSLIPQNQTFMRPDDFDALNFLMESIATIPGTWYVETLLKTSLDEARQRIPPQMATLEPQPVGVLMRCYVGDLPWVARFLVHTGLSFAVRQPDDLRDTLRNMADDLRRVADDRE
jgi:predicted DNA-binding transcriptional regulator YafY